METVQTIPPRHQDTRCKAITEIIEAVAEQQEALARILEAEHKKIEKTIGLCGTDVGDLVMIDKSVERVLAAVTRLELALQLKLDLFHDCLCPNTPCSGS
ncbi:MAG: hypothetical protein ACI3VE_02680 [Oscillospiraceae bacterium]